MSRIGRLPISLPKNVTVDVKPGNEVIVKGPKGQLEQSFNVDMAIEDEMFAGPPTCKRSGDVRPLGLCYAIFDRKPARFNRVMQEGCCRTRVAGRVGRPAAHEALQELDEQLTRNAEELFRDIEQPKGRPYTREEFTKTVTRASKQRLSSSSQSQRPPVETE